MKKLLLLLCYLRPILAADIEAYGPGTGTITLKTLASGNSFNYSGKCITVPDTGGVRITFTTYSGTYEIPTDGSKARIYGVKNEVIIRGYQDGTGKPTSVRCTVFDGDTIINWGYFDLSPILLCSATVNNIDLGAVSPGTYTVHLNASSSTGSSLRYWGTSLDSDGTLRVGGRKDVLLFPDRLNIAPATGHWVASRGASLPLTLTVGPNAVGGPVTSYLTAVLTCE
ncbi:hypothetical protein SAMN05192562_11261 [Kosakonia arachidis]|uniref:Pilin (Type 1 fimbria component protein) n=1 Tax=Kosakonia arachidis TaxID=551989 RepID=A0A1I7E919_9ENTR|nr:hypothetical protein SAMN05192562_11261 [Kosakonia arachidis]